MAKSLKPIPQHPFFRVIFFSTVTGVLLLITSILTLPSLVSTKWFKNIAQETINKHINRPVTIEGFNWSWMDGLRITGVALKDDPIFSAHPIFYLKEASLKIQFGDIWSGRVGADIYADSIDIRMVRNSEGETSLDHLFSISKPDDIQKEEIEKKINPGIGFSEFSFSLPIDVKSNIRFRNISFFLDDQMLNRKMALKNGTVELQIPSLFFKPVKMLASGAVMIDNLEPSPFNVSLLIENRLTSEKKYIISNTLINMAGNLPGISISVNGNLMDQGINGKIALDLSAITNMAMPFLPDNLSNSQFKGNIELNLDATIKTGQIISFDSHIYAKEMGISGEIIQNRKLLPVNATVALKGSFNLETGDLDIHDGILNTLKNNRISLQGNIQGLNGKSPRADLFMGPIFFNLKEIYGHIAPSIPEIQTLHLDFHENPSILTVDQIQFSGSLISGSAKVTMAGFELSVPGLDITSGDTSLALLDLKLTVPEAATVLENYFPTKADIAINLGVDQIDIKEPSSIHLNKLIISGLDVGVKDIEKEQYALLGLSGQVTLKQSMKLEGIAAPGLVEIGGFAQSLEANCSLLKEKKAALRINSFKAVATDFSVDNPVIDSQKAGIDLDLSAPHIIIHNIDPFSADIKDAETSVKIDNLVRLKMTAGAMDFAASELNTRGQIKIDLQNLAEYLPDNLFESLKLSGICKMDWDIKGRRPNKKEVDRLKQIGGVNLKNDLKFIEHIDTSIQFVDTNVDLQLLKKGRINLGPFSAMPLIHYHYNGGEGKGDINGRIMIDGVEEVPGFMFDTPISGEISFSGIHTGLENFTLSQELVSNQLNLEETLMVSISGINRILRESPHVPWPQWLKMAGAGVQGHIRISDCSVLNQFQEEMVLKGALGVDTSVTLIPGESISVGMLTEFNHVFLNFEKYMSMEDLHGRLDFSKVYGIDNRRRQQKGEAAQRERLLSLRVMETGIFSSRTDTYFRHGSEIATQFNPDQTIVFSSAKSDAGPVPIELSMFRAELGLNQGLPELKRFQVDLLGGTIIGAFAVLQRNGLFFVYAWINFTGIDLAGFFPKEGRKTKKQDTEISGQLNIFLPVSTQLSTFLENVRVDLFFSHIGIRALERFFYALDPYENNEVIVTQRRILKTGSPRFIRMDVKDGSLSITGEIDVKGTTLQIPLEPINITNLSSFNKLEGALDILTPVIEILRIASSDTIQLEETITFK